MPSELQVFAFEFQGVAETRREKFRDTKIDDVDLLSDDNISYALNQQADDIAKEIQLEVGSRLPPSVSVQVTIRFSPLNSIHVGGIVLLSRWIAAPIMLKVAEKLVEATAEQLVPFVRFGAEKALSKCLAGSKAKSPVDKARITPPKLQVEPLSTPTNQSGAIPQPLNTQGPQPTTFQIASPITVEFDRSIRNSVLFTAISTVGILLLLIVPFVVGTISEIIRSSGGNTSPPQTSSPAPPTKSP